MRRTLIGLAVVFAFVGATLAVTAEDGKYSVKDVMKQAHGGRPNLLTKVSQGNATDAEKAKLVMLYESMPAGKPKKGDEAEFKKMGEAMVEAAKAAKAGEKGWQAKLKTATNCKACHDLFK